MTARSSPTAIAAPTTVRFSHRKGFVVVAGRIDSIARSAARRVRQPERQVCMHTGVTDEPVPGRRIGGEAGFEFGRAGVIEAPVQVVLEQDGERVRRFWGFASHRFRVRVMHWNNACRIRRSELYTLWGELPPGGGRGHPAGVCVTLGETTPGPVGQFRHAPGEGFPPVRQFLVRDILVGLDEEEVKVVSENTPLPGQPAGEVGRFEPGHPHAHGKNRRPGRTGRLVPTSPSPSVGTGRRRGSGRARVNECSRTDDSGSRPTAGRTRPGCDAFPPQSPPPSLPSPVKYRTESATGNADSAYEAQPNRHGNSVTPPFLRLLLAGLERMSEYLPSFRPAACGNGASLLRRVTMGGRFRRVTVPALFLTFAAGGCGRSDPVETPMPQAEKDLGTISQAYKEAFERTNKAPENFEDLRPYLKSLGRTPEDIQVSPNDGQPYVVLWGCDPTRGGSSGAQALTLIVCHEKTGKDGKRAVSDTRGRVATVTDEEFARLRFIPKK